MEGSLLAAKPVSWPVPTALSPRYTSSTSRDQQKKQGASCEAIQQHMSVCEGLRKDSGEPGNAAETKVVMRNAEPGRSALEPCSGLAAVCLGQVVQPCCISFPICQLGIIMISTSDIGWEVYGQRLAQCWVLFPSESG